VQTLCQTDEDVFLLLDGKDDEGLHDLLLEHLMKELMDQPNLAMHIAILPLKS